MPSIYDNILAARRTLILSLFYSLHFSSIVSGVLTFYVLSKLFPLKFSMYRTHEKSFRVYMGYYTATVGSVSILRVYDEASQFPPYTENVVRRYY